MGEEGEKVEVEVCWSLQWFLTYNIVLGVKVILLHCFPVLLTPNNITVKLSPTDTRCPWGYHGGVCVSFLSSSVVLSTSSFHFLSVAFSLVFPQSWSSFPLNSI